MCDMQIKLMKIVRCFAGLIGIFSMLIFSSCQKAKFADPLVQGRWVGVQRTSQPKRMAFLWLSLEISPGRYCQLDHDLRWEERVAVWG